MTAAVQSLLALASLPAERIEARAAWVRATCAALRQAQRNMDAAATPPSGRLSERSVRALCAAEQAKVDAIRAPIDAVIERDVWPRELYFGCV